MKRFSIQFIQEKIYQTHPRNELVILEHELAKLLQIETKRLHDKLSAATHVIPQFNMVTDAEFEFLKRKYNYNKSWNKDKYWNVFTKEEISKMQNIFQPSETAYKVIPTIILAFEDLIIPYEKMMKRVIYEKRKKETIVYWVGAIALFIIISLVYILFQQQIDVFISNKYLKGIFTIFYFLFQPVVTTMLAREKFIGWCEQKRVDDEYNSIIDNSQ